MPSTTTGCVSVPLKVSPTAFLLDASAWFIRIVMKVPGLIVTCEGKPYDWRIGCAMGACCGGGGGGGSCACP